MIREMKPEEVQKTTELIRQSGMFIDDDTLTLSGFYEGSKTYLYMVEDFLVGTVGIRDNSRIVYLCVHPDYRRYGFAEELMKYVMKNHKDLYLFVKILNRGAICLYWKMGFKITGLRHTEHYSWKMEAIHAA